MMREIHIGGLINKVFIKVRNDYQFITILFLGIIAAAMIQYVLRIQQSHDMEKYFIMWYMNIQNRGFTVLGSGISNYPPLYLYFLYIISILAPKLPIVIAVKIPSLIALWGIAFYNYKIISLLHENRWVRLLAFLIPLFTPTLLLNSAYWGQADCMYGVFVLGAVYYLMVKKKLSAFIFLGLAFSIKSQTIFIFPLVALMLLKKEVSIKYVLIIPLVYLISIIPVLMIGRPLSDLLTLYFHQVTGMPGLVYNAPTIFAFLPDTDQEMFLSRAGILVGIFSIIVLTIIGLIKTGSRPLSVRDVIEFGLLSATIVVYCLPYIHERYFFISEMLAVAYAFCFPKHYYVSFSLILIGLFTYIKISLR